jgi:4-hydroxy-tetrahydrodipicolinate synthase
MNTKHVSGVYAAVLSPRNSDNTIDTGALTTLVRFLLAKGISNFAVNGATGEYCLTRPDHLRSILSTVHQAGEGKARILCGIGAPGAALTIELASIAQQQNVHGLLLPMPFFFEYKQLDLDHFCRTVAKATTLPILLYNLPQFTSGIEKETVLRLITEVPNIIGIKDSSGSLDIFRHLTQHNVGACRIVGNDIALAPALTEDICDGVISGVAGVAPEMMLALYAERRRPGSPEYQHLTRLLSEFIEQLNVFPTPWGLKWALEAREVLPATFSLPIAPQRIMESAKLISWIRTHSVIPQSSPFRITTPLTPQ